MDLNWCGGLIVAFQIVSSLPEASGFKSSFVCDLNVIYSSSLPEASGFKYIDMRNCIHHIWSSLPEARHFKLRQKKQSTPSNAIFYKILLILHIWYDFSKSLKPPKNLYLSYFRKF